MKQNEPYTVLYSRLYKERFKENLNRLDKALKSIELPPLNDDGENLLSKIKDEAIKLDRKPAEILNEVITNFYYRSTYVIDPAKQNLAEEVAEIKLREIKCLTNITKLPDRGKKAFYICNGKLETGRAKKEKNSNKSSKAIDFYCVCGKYKVFIFHKRTHEGGGTQDDICSEVYSFINHVKSNGEKDTIFIIICDGQYFSNKRSDGSSVLEELSNECIDMTNVKVSNLENSDLENYLNTLIPSPNPVN